MSTHIYLKVHAQAEYRMHPYNIALDEEATLKKYAFAHGGEIVHHWSKTIGPGQFPVQDRDGEKCVELVMDANASSEDTGVHWRCQRVGMAVYGR